MTDYKLGQLVRYGEHIRRRHSRPGEFLGPNRIWSNHAGPGMESQPWEGGEGIIVGKRTLSHGVHGLPCGLRSASQAGARPTRTHHAIGGIMTTEPTTPAPAQPFDYDAPLPTFPDYRPRSWEPAARHYRDLTDAEKESIG